MNTATIPSTFQHLIGEHQTFLEAKRIAKQFSLSELPVLITGKIGTGKDHFAQAIHQGSSRYSEPFISVNCSTHSEESLMRELFGPNGNSGVFQKTARGTLFLDEVWRMPASVQAQLLKVLDSDTEKPRIICASADGCAEHTFRQDLFYRLNILTLTLPELSERKSDIPLLTQYFLSHSGQQLLIDPSVFSMLEQHTFEGNVRELKNAADYMAAVANGGTIHPYDLPPYIRGTIDEKASKKKAKLLTLMEKAEFLFILETIKALNEKGEPASRRIISEHSKNTQTSLSPQQVRSRLDYLEKKDYVTKSRGRAGTKITLEGLNFLETLKNQMI
ncbi:sigma 54-interacting transcriptional regulator [Bacillus spizizenii]|uniref:sigma 54-interacting transcriptional regulator n=1 Tax=Bacillus TaxID=1386 RepID=UPI0007723F10|nr:sigma 54-interacting transcriptional regulator [Bacillus spizizenii]APH68913.1 AAA family ATPase [Bacillus subtilis]KXJ35217.1 AAA family ATPase [Bacillus spizizenii]OPG92436.1 AAA family ATPase [Bacillus spizizenii]